MIICKICNRELEDNNFYKSNKSKCKDCIKTIRIEKIKKNKKLSANKLLQNGYKQIKGFGDYYINQYGEIKRVFFRWAYWNNFWICMQKKDIRL